MPCPYFIAGRGILAAFVLSLSKSLGLSLSKDFVLSLSKSFGLSLSKDFALSLSKGFGVPNRIRHRNRRFGFEERVLDHLGLERACLDKRGRGEAGVDVAPADDRPRQQIVAIAMHARRVRGKRGLWREHAA
jgi:hypothetical protein